jgi:hypothetical protein
MRSRLILIVIVLSIVAAACGGKSDSETPTDVQLVWCAQVGNGAIFDAIWDAADEIGVNSIGAFLLDEAGITTDVDPRELATEDLTEEELTALSAVGDDFDSSDALWIAYIDSPDGAKACLAAYRNVNG